MEAPTITALDCGRMRTQQRTLLAGGSHDEISFPIVAYLVRHPKGVVVFDAGLHPDLAHGDDRLGVNAKFFTVELAPGRTVGPRLADAGIDPTSRFDVVVSHCHFDHVGGLVELPNARLLVQGVEWQAGLLGEGIDEPVTDLGHDVVELDGDHDVFGDGSVVCIPTPGHTCGHQSLRVRTSTGPVILAGDACYFSHTLDDEVLPPFAFDEALQRRSLAMLQRERRSGTVIVPGHDDAVYATLLE